MTRNDHVLKTLAEAGLDSAFETLVDLEIIRHRPQMTKVGGFGKQRPGCITVLGARRVELFERLEARDERGEIVLA